MLSSAVQGSEGTPNFKLDRVFPDGSRRIYSFHIQTILHDGQISLLIVNWDITEIEMARREAEEGKRTLEAVMHYIPEGISIADAPDVQVRMISKYGLDLIGRSFDEVVGRPRTEWWKIYHPIEGTRASVEQMPLSGKITGVVSAWRDITNRKKAEQAIKEYSARLEEYSEQLEARVRDRTEELVNLQRSLGESDP